MQEIKDVLEKIELQTNKKIEELKKEFMLTILLNTTKKLRK